MGISINRTECHLTARLVSSSRTRSLNDPPNKSRIYEEQARVGRNRYARQVAVRVPQRFSRSANQPTNQPKSEHKMMKQ